MTLFSRNFLLSFQRAEKPAEAEAAAADNRDDGGAGPSEEERAKRKKEKEYYLSNGERLAVQRCSQLHACDTLQGSEGAFQLIRTRAAICGLLAQRADSRATAPPCTEGAVLVPPPPVCSAPRRYEDGLPVFKSFEDFSDLQAVRDRQEICSS